MSDDDEREAITAAMQRLLAGRPLRSSGDLTIVALAEEAGLRRNKLTHKHTDLKDLFYAEVKARNGIPASEIKLREEIAALKTRIESVRQERDDYRAATETFARAINALTVENDTLRNKLDKRRSSGVAALPKRP
jgi:chromosome segregation ATPase